MFVSKQTRNLFCQGVCDQRGGLWYVLTWSWRRAVAGTTDPVSLYLRVSAVSVDASEAKVYTHSGHIVVVDTTTSNIQVRAAANFRTAAPAPCLLAWPSCLLLRPRRCCTNPLSAQVFSPSGAFAMDFATGASAAAPTVRALIATPTPPGSPPPPPPGGRPTPTPARPGPPGAPPPGVNPSRNAGGIRTGQH